MIYLASPCSHPNPAVRDARYAAVLNFTARHIAQGHHVYSPIVYGHYIGKAMVLAGEGSEGQESFDYWRDFDVAMLRRCQFLWVLQIDGWEKSIGVKAEIEEARKCGIPVRMVKP